MKKAQVDLIASPVEVCILRDGKPLMSQIFQHTPIRIGRILENDIVLPFDSISRHHCELQFSGGRWMIVDLKSMNGLKINGERVASAVIDTQGEFELKPVTLQLRVVKPAVQPIEPTQIAAMGDSTAPEYISSTEETLVGPGPQPTAAKRLHNEQPQAAQAKPKRAEYVDNHVASKKPVLHVDGLSLMSDVHPMIEKAKSRAVQVTVFWFDVLMSVDEFLPGEEMIVEINGIYLRLGRVGRERSEVRCPSGTEFSNRPGKESVLLTTAPVSWTADWGLSINARYAPASKNRPQGLVPLIADELINPMAISGLVHGSVAAATMFMNPKPAPDVPPQPERVAKIIVTAPTPSPLIARATPTPTPPPPPMVKATPTPAPTLQIQAKATPKPKPIPKEVKRKDPPKIAKVDPPPAPKAEVEVKMPKVAKSNPPPPGPKTEAPPAPTPKPFNAASVGALKALSLLSVPAPSSQNTERIVVRKTASTEDGGGSGSPSTSNMMKNLPLKEGGSEDGVVGGMALNVSEDGNGYGTAGFSGKTGKRGVLGSVIGGATYTELAKTEGLSREQVMKVVQKHHTQIQQCYERSLMDDPALSGRAEFEWEISAKGVVSNVGVKETSLRNADRLLDCVKGVFRAMKFPTAKNGSSTTPTIGLPFGRL